MKIPFGQRKPSTQEAVLLIKLGFNLDSMEQLKGVYYLNLPDDPKINCEKTQPDFDKISYTIKYNNVTVIDIDQKTAFWDPFVSFNILASSVEQALTQKNEVTEIEEKTPKPVQLKNEAKQELNPAIESIKSEFKQILVDIRLLQRTCQMANYDWMRPRKYAHLSLHEAQNEQRRLIPRMRELNSKLSLSDSNQVMDEAEKEARNLIEITAGAPTLGFAFTK